MVKDWQYHYVVGPPSQPSWRYERLADVLVYLPTRADEQAFEQFRTVAAAHGATR
ncbi:MAG: hypothetical protein HY856_10670 [Burkholderiales bacterium]|nr:hypothetical protein [Burkholderiales bacterium]